MPVRTFLLVSVLALLCLAVAIASTTEDAGPTPVHAADNLPQAETWTPVTATPVMLACPAETEEKVTRFSLLNMPLQRRCLDQSGGVNSFPFDYAPTREQLVRLSASPACLMVSKAMLRIFELECILGDYAMAIRATSETILKLSQDREDLAMYPVPQEDELQQQIAERAKMNHARDVDPISFSIDQYPIEMQQYESQLANAYATGGIILLSSDMEVMNDISSTEQIGSEAAEAAVAELVDAQGEATTTSAISSGSASHADSASELDEEVVESSSTSGSHGSFRDEPSSASGSLTDSSVVTQPPSSSTMSLKASFTMGVLSGLVLLLI